MTQEEVNTYWAILHLTSAPTFQYNKLIAHMKKSFEKYISDYLHHGNRLNRFMSGCLRVISLDNNYIDSNYLVPKIQHTIINNSNNKYIISIDKHEVILLNTISIYIAGNRDTTSRSVVTLPNSNGTMIFMTIFNEYRFHRTGYCTGMIEIFDRMI